MDYEFTFVVDGATVDDDEAVSRLEDELDAMLARGGGLNLLKISYEGSSAVQAALQAAEHARQLVPELRILRLDRDVVGVPEIADRTERSMQNVHQWTRGERLASGAPFPLPEGTAGRVHVWLWCEVNEWLRQHGLDDSLNYPSRYEMAQIDTVLANGRSLSSDSAPIPGYDDARHRVRRSLQANLMSFAQFVSGLGVSGSLTIVIADAAEPAHEVMQFIGSKGHDTVLVTGTDEEIMGVHFTTEADGPEIVVSVPGGSTVWEWMDLVKEQPSATFVPDSAVAPLEIARVQDWLAAKAA